MNIVKKKASEFIYNNQSSKDFKLLIKKNGIKIIGSDYDVSMINIPGRKALHKNNGKKTNLRIEIECYLETYKAMFEDVEDMLKDIKFWLQGDVGYKELYFDDEEVYYEAVCFNKLDISEVLSKYTECKIIFECKSKKSRSGDIFLDIPPINNYRLFNSFDISKPLIRIKGNGDITLHINSQVIILKGIENEIFIDNLIMNAYKNINGQIINQNNKMFSDFVVLEKGNNFISYTGDVMKLSIMPRWEIDD